ncbi:polymorphic toxin-type HINT domain-containing protein [Fuerstiella marisgermanici]|uniref:Intein C-terminal splicing domain-containing protein n=1 Tax=Fuerstiella marisgermanici TaxID=1891926 RepID=A0A1P8WKB9_9PLAN|nr:polymorphic toxin-type HINT domain-containing protein [Fuerstiella marisgermanici]APZ94501.1 hypothetical protein Fuma_04133 [Fuerstiella marisgermanici]
MKHEPDSERNKVTRLRQVVILGCLIVGCVFAMRATIPHASATSDVKTELTAEISPAVPSAADPIRLRTRNIEDIQLGQRVVGRNPLREETQPPSDINPATWRAVQLSMFKGGVKYDLAFLRRLSWIEGNAAKVGHSIHLELHEMGLNGPALVVSIDPCPEIEVDDGTGRNVVTGTMSHPAGNILYLDITGLDEPLGVTDTHPLWSETRHEFVVAGKLEVGEQFRSLTGETATLTKITPHRGSPEMVFNLEVDGEHVYSVADGGLLVHNDCIGWVNGSDLSGERILMTGSEEFGGLIGRIPDYPDVHPAYPQHAFILNGDRLYDEMNPLGTDAATWFGTFMEMNNIESATDMTYLLQFEGL